MHTKHQLAVDLSSSKESSCTKHMLMESMIVCGNTLDLHECLHKLHASGALTGTPALPEAHKVYTGLRCLIS